MSAMINETILADLHSHTTASDGRLTPASLVARAIEMQVEMLAITDHDTVAGLAEAHKFNNQQENPLHLINGVEISTHWQSFDIHIVALNVDVNNDALLAFLERQRELRELRALEIGVRLNKAGIANAYEGAKRFADGAAISRAHYARFLVEQGYAADNNGVFKRYLAKGKTGYVPNNWSCMSDAIEIIHQAQGIAVLAHPSAYKLSKKWLKRLIQDFKLAGGDAMEVVLGQQTIEDRNNLASLSIQHELSASLGSDFHFPGGWVELGKNLYQPPGIEWVWTSKIWNKK